MKGETKRLNLATFIEIFQEAITRAVLRAYPPLYLATKQAKRIG